MNIETLNWDPLLLKVFGITDDVTLPDIRSSSEIYGHIQYGSKLDGIPISGASTLKLFIVALLLLFVFNFRY